MGKPYVRLDKDNAAVLLVDHQTGLLSLVRDIDPDKFKNNVLALAEAAQYFNLPTILTTSFEQGPNGPLVPELKEMFPDAPYIARPGQINASEQGCQFCRFLLYIFCMLLNRIIYPDGHKCSKHTDYQRNACQNRTVKTHCNNRRNNNHNLS